MLSWHVGSVLYAIWEETAHYSHSTSVWCQLLHTNLFCVGERANVWAMSWCFLSSKSPVTIIWMSMRQHLSACQVHKIRYSWQCIDSTVLPLVMMWLILTFQTEVLRKYGCEFRTISSPLSCASCGYWLCNRLEKEQPPPQVTKPHLFFPYPASLTHPLEVDVAPAVSVRAMCDCDVKYQALKLRSLSSGDRFCPPTHMLQHCYSGGL